MTIPDDKLMTRTELAEVMQVSKSAIEKGYFSCLTEIRHAGKVLFNPRQVLMHREIIWSGEDCNGRCKEALKTSKAQVINFRRKKAS
jgi:hypothetical protein